MQTATFQCGHCGKLIAVGPQTLGVRVRCPHCLGVVLAQTPLSTMAGPAESTSEGVPVTAAIPAEDAAPLPSAAPPLAAGAVESALPQPPAPSAAPAQTPTADNAAQPPTTEHVPTEPASDAPSTEAVATTTGWPPTEPGTELFSAEEPGEPAGFPRQRRAPSPQKAGVSLWLVIPLVSYSILATVLVFMLWTRLHAVEENPLAAFLPDSEGDAPGVIRKPKGVNEARKRKLVNDPLPESLIVHPGQTRTLGALEVTPRRIVREQVGVGVGDGAPEKISGLSLVLFLELKNVSEDQSFQPLDRYFDRKWREDSSSGPPPLTLLEAGSGQRLFGGPARWHPQRPADRRNNSAAPEFIYLMGRDKPIRNPIDRILGPGETSEVFVCTDASDPRAGQVATRQGEFLWRVHLRRGLVRVRGRDVPAAAVIGVAFSSRDVHDG